MHTRLKETFSKYETIILIGWWTGWHIQPIVNVAKELKGKEILWIGGKNSNEEEEALNAKIPFKSIYTLKLSTTKSPKVLLYPFSLLRWIMEAWIILRNWRKNSCVFSKGWPGSVAVGLAAWSLWIPIYIHESDTIPGRSNRILGKIATRVFLGFEQAKKYFDGWKCEVVGQILHSHFGPQAEIGNQIKEWKKEEVDEENRFVPHYDRAHIVWKTQKPHILVICGSQWAKSVFEAILNQFQKDTEYEWIIALGKLNSGMREYFEKMKDAQAFDWIPQEKIAELLSDTALVITRGSATTLAEIDTFKVKKIIIPLPYAANNHQYWNAKEYEKTGDIILEQKNIFRLKQEIQQIWQNLPPSST